MIIIFKYPIQKYHVWNSRDASDKARTVSLWKKRNSVDLKGQPEPAAEGLDLFGHCISFT